jgi:hypothetical protein
VNAVCLFLVAWSHFVATHTCLTWGPDGSGGYHVVYGGNCTDAFNLARTIHGGVSFSGASTGAVGAGAPSLP